MDQIDRLWRIIGTGLSFLAFGIGGLLISLTILPAMHLVSADRSRAQYRCQYIVHRSFGLFIAVMHRLGVLTYSFEGCDGLAKRRGALVVANHPSLIDVVFIISWMPQALCVVKKSMWHNPLLMGVMRATGYIPNDEPEQLIANCVQALERGDNLVIFPEGTRTQRGTPMKLKNGAASIIEAGGRPFVPVHIRCDPLTLGKGEPWYRVPRRKPHFRIECRQPVNPDEFMLNDEKRMLAKRRINRELVRILTG